MQARAKIAVASATGRVGRHVVVLEERGHQVARIARSAGVDVITGEGLAAALDGMKTPNDVTSAGPHTLPAGLTFEEWPRKEIP